LAEEQSEVRISGGIHFRMGRKIAALLVANTAVRKQP